MGANDYIAYGTLQDFDIWITTHGMDNVKLRKFGEKIIIMEAKI